ncbi:MAG: hypothetical protein COB98_04105 [Flavobacteriaceae bacterium]|nr:MAG: hypothetical protein COB98_04105 [Flavobacteriaceae bacterium]
MNTVNLSKFFKSIQAIHFGVMISVIFISLLLFINIKEQVSLNFQGDRLFMFMAIIIGYGGKFVGKMMFNRLMEQLPFKAGLFLKTEKYKVAHIVRLLLLNFPMFMCLYFAFVTNNSFYFIVIGLLFFMMLTVFPSRNRFSEEVALNNDEKRQLFR